MQYSRFYTEGRVLSPAKPVVREYVLRGCMVIGLVFVALFILSDFAQARRDLADAKREYAEASK